jgi:hypothetical protein
MEVLVDFGREVYIPWRITEGENLGTDIVHPYGPFSTYFNAVLFAVFGVSVRTLAVANLLIFAAVVFILYKLLRRAFGFFPAALALAFVIPVMGLGHITNLGNYSFLMPYSHEATHGMLFLLLWIWGIQHCNPKTRFTRHLLLGAALGLLCMTKTEYIAAMGVIAVTIGLRAWRDLEFRGVVRSAVPGQLVGMMLVLSITWIGLCLRTDPEVALRTTFNAVVAPLSFGSYTKSAHVAHYLGTDDLAGNLRKIGVAGSISFGWLVIGALFFNAAAAAANKVVRIAIAVATGALMFGCLVKLQPIQSGYAFPFLLTFGLGALVWRILRGKRSPAVNPRDWARALLLAAAIGMMLRMFLNPRIEHYGFFQAFLAAAWIVAFYVSIWPDIAVREKLERGVFRTVIVAVCAVAAVIIDTVTLRHATSKTGPIGAGADRVFAFPPKIYPRHSLWEEARKYLVQNTPAGGSLLVLPEGISLNYFTRRKHPVGVMDMLPATLPLNPKDVLQQIRENPPDAVVLIRRDGTEELGFKTYGASDASGKKIVEWVLQNYALVQQAGGYPFSPDDPTSYGIWILKRKAAGSSTK